MVTETRKVFAMAALIVATGVAAVETTRGSAQADTLRGAATYASTRIEGAFRVVRAMPSVDFASIGIAKKGALLLAGCTEPHEPRGCTMTAYDTASAGTVVEVRRGTSSSVLTRLARMSVAGI